MDKGESFCKPTCEDQINLAERELSAFIRAVMELFGPKQARLSTEDWLDESDRMDWPPLAASRDWRAVTVAASARLANRAPALEHRTLVASVVTQISPIPSSNCFASALLVRCLTADDDRAGYSQIATKKTKLPTKSRQHWL